MNLKTVFPNASASFLALNSGSPAELERTPRNAALGKAKAKDKDTRRFLVRVESRRYRLLDADNICEKYHVDCCRYAGVLPSDAPSQTKIETSQVKIGKEEPERVEMTIEEIA